MTWIWLQIRFKTDVNLMEVLDRSKLWLKVEFSWCSIKANWKWEFLRVYCFFLICHDEGYWCKAQISINKYWYNVQDLLKLLSNILVPFIICGSRNARSCVEFHFLVPWQRTTPSIISSNYFRFLKIQKQDSATWLYIPCYVHLHAFFKESYRSIFVLEIYWDVQS